MSDGRDAIMDRIRRARKRGPLADVPLKRVENRLAKPARGTVPERTRRERSGLLDLFVEKAEAVAATVQRVSAEADVPAAVADYLARHNLPAQVRRAPDPELDALPWDRAPMLELGVGKADPADTTGIAVGQAGIAETGTLMLCSGPGGPTTLNFLPENHVVVLRASRIVGGYEDAWDGLRDRLGRGRMPRTVNMITGPSRTGDIEQTIQLGAHGPRRLHILIVEDQ